MSNFDVFSNGNALVYDFRSISAYVRRKPQPANPGEVEAKPAEVDNVDVARESRYDSWHRRWIENEVASPDNPHTHGIKARRWPY